MSPARSAGRASAVASRPHHREGHPKDHRGEPRRAPKISRQSRPPYRPVWVRDKRLDLSPFTQITLNTLSQATQNPHLSSPPAAVAQFQSVPPLSHPPLSPPSPPVYVPPRSPPQLPPLPLLPSKPPLLPRLTSRLSRRYRLHNTELPLPLPSKLSLSSPPPPVPQLSRAEDIASLCHCQAVSPGGNREHLVPCQPLHLLGD